MGAWKNEQRSTRGSQNTALLENDLRSRVVCPRTTTATKSHETEHRRACGVWEESCHRIVDGRRKAEKIESPFWCVVELLVFFLSENKNQQINLGWYPRTVRETCSPLRQTDMGICRLVYSQPISVTWCSHLAHVACTKLNERAFASDTPWNLGLNICSPARAARLFSPNFPSCRNP